MYNHCLVLKLGNKSNISQYWYLGKMLGTIKYHMLNTWTV